MSNHTNQTTLPQAIQNLSAAAQRLSAIATQLNQIVTAGHTLSLDNAGQLAVTDAAVNLDVAMVSLTPEQRRVCERVINVFETGTIQGKYGAISIFEDGPNDIRQITYGRSQTTEYGNLRELVQMYVDAGGRFSQDLREFLPRIGRTALVDNSRFKGLLRRAGNEDPVMQRTQDIFFDRRYFQPALRWADQNGFTRALSSLVIYDSFIHSGSILDFLRARFTERPPASGGDEQTWVSQYIDVRHRWLLTHRRPAVRASAYRTRDLGREIARGNWDLSLLPIMANGVPVDAAQAHAIAGVLDTGMIADDIPYLGEPEATAGGAEEYDQIWGDDAYGLSDTAAADLALTAAGGTPSDLAARILNHSDIALATVHSSGVQDQATARQNIADTAHGERARRSNYGNAPGGRVALDGHLLRGLLALADQHSFAVSEIAGGSHNPNSRHYVGIAADFNRLNGRPVRAGHPDLAAFKAQCRDLGATELRGPGDAHHDTHVHAAWPRPA